MCRVTGHQPQHSEAFQAAAPKAFGGLRHRRAPIAGFMESFDLQNWMHIGTMNRTVVAQTGSLLCRRLAVGRARLARGRFMESFDLQSWMHIGSMNRTVVAQTGPDSSGCRRLAVGRARFVGCRFMESLHGQLSRIGTMNRSGARSYRDAATVSPSPRLAGAEGPNGERAGVRCSFHHLWGSWRAPCSFGPAHAP